MLNFVIPLRRDTLNVFYCRKTFFPYICRTIDDRTYKQILDKKGFQGMRSNRKRGYLVVELETAEINSRRIASAAALPF